MRAWFFLILISIVLASCSDKDGKGEAVVPPNSQPGWTPELIENLIACQPYPGSVCDCVVPQITVKYKPSQVREKSPFVAADMLAIRSGCENSALGNSTQKNDPAPTGFAYPSFRGNNCETGAHRFDNHAEFCRGLQSESLNHECARAERADHFSRSCPGTFTPGP